MIIKSDSVAELYDEVYLIKNFISEEEIAAFMQIINSTEEDEWGKDYVAQLKRESMHQFGTEDYAAMVEQGKMHMNPEWLDKSLEISGSLPATLANRIKELFVNKVSLNPMDCVQRHYPGSFMQEHVDQEHDPSLIYACVIYLNDDFNGGELYFPDIDLEVKPIRGSLMLFSASKKYLHGVRKVLPGPTRYAITGFVWDN